MKQISKIAIELILALSALYVFTFFLNIADETNCKGMFYFVSIFPLSCFLHYALSATRRVIILSMYNLRKYSK